MELREVLKDTLLQACNSSGEFFETASCQKLSSELWNFDITTLSPLTVENLNYVQLHHGQVCRRIAWPRALQIALMTKSGKNLNNMKLPLTPQFIVGMFSKKSGNPAASDYWMKHLDLSVGFQIVYGYNLSSKGPTPLKGKQKKIFKDFSDHEHPGTNIKALVNAEKQTTAIVRLPRILICLSLCCFKIDEKFDPEGILRSGRIYPLVELICNGEIQSAKLIDPAQIVISRPRDLAQEMPNMASRRTIYTFSDRNIIDDFYLPTRRLPFWSALFDYYLIPEKLNSTVTRDFWLYKDGDLEKQAKIANKESLNFAFTRNFTFVTDNENCYIKDKREIIGITGQFGYDKTDIKKNKRQGSFDNIHIAPPLYYDIDHEYFEGYQEVVMAPICEHDCFHTHTRWGNAVKTDQEWVRGWSYDLANPRPFSQLGAPLVPPNQEIDIELFIKSEEVGFIYKCYLSRIGPCKLQIIYHHGSGYAVGVNQERANELAGLANRAAGFITGSPFGSPKFYFNLRYADINQPRVREDNMEELSTMTK